MDIAVAVVVGVIVAVFTVVNDAEVVP